MRKRLDKLKMTIATLRPRSPASMGPTHRDMSAEQLKPEHMCVRLPNTAPSMAIRKTGLRAKRRADPIGRVVKDANNGGKLTLCGCLDRGTEVARVARMT